MWFSLFSSVLVLAVTFYQGLLGLFTSAINCMLTILAAALAFGFYEDLYYGGPYPLIEHQPEQGRAIALMAIFIISLIVMRLIVDLLIKENMKFPVYIDRIGGGILGFVTAMLTIGMLCIGIEMLPFSHEFLGFSRYNMYERETGKPVVLIPRDEKKGTDADALAELDLSTVKLVRQRLWVSPDSFTVGLASFLSDNALTGTNSLSKVSPDLLDELFWMHFAPQGQNTSVARKPDAITVEACWVLKDDLYVPEKSKSGDSDKKIKLNAPKDDYQLPDGYRWLVVRAKLSKDATDDGISYRFTTGQVRLVTRSKSGAAHDYHLVGIDALPESLSDVPAKIKTLYYRLTPGQTIARKSGRFDFVFQVPEEEDPSLIVFRVNARAEVRGVSKEEPGPLSASPKNASNKGGKGNGSSRANNSSRNSGRNGGSADNGNANSGNKPEINKHTNGDPGDEARSGGRTRRYTADETGSFFGEELPLTLTSYNTEAIEVRNPKILGGNGRLTAKLDQNDQPLKGNQPALSSFDVPSDKRLLQVSVRRLHPGSTLAQAMDFARQLGNVEVKDDAGGKYPAVGTWGIATVSRQRLFECVFFDETTRVGSSAPPKLDVIRAGNMNNDYALYYLFLIPPGKHIVAFEVPNGPEEDLRSANLVAPK